MGMTYGGFLSLIFAAQVPDKIGKIITFCPDASFLKQRKSFFIKMPSCRPVPCKRIFKSIDG
jgi:hypothetical protein